MCLYPKLITNRKYTKTKKNGGVIPAIFDERVRAVPVACGECMECRKKKAREWQARLIEDIKHNKKGKFVTLTFSDEEITKLYNNEKIKDLKGYEKDNAAATLAMRLFNERWRKKYKKAIRHWVVTELGHKGTENIHMHGILWTEEDNKTIEQIWSYGHIWVGTFVSEKTVNYTIKYVNKADGDHRFYKSKILTSPGIGKGYTERKDSERNKYKEGTTKEDYRTRTGHSMSIPIYWRNKIYTEEEREKLWIEKLNKNERWVDGIKIDVSEGLETYYKLLTEARKKNKRLGYGQVKDWNRKKYEEERRKLLQEKRGKIE